MEKKFQEIWVIWISKFKLLSCDRLFISHEKKYKIVETEVIIMKIISSFIDLTI